MHSSLPPSLGLNGRFDLASLRRSHRYQNLIKRLVNRNRRTLILGGEVDPVENFVPGTAWNFHRCNSAGGISEVSAITSQIEILFGRPVYGRSSHCKHTSPETEKESLQSVSLFLFLYVCVRVWVVRVLCACVEYGRFLRKIKVGRKSFIACLPHRNCCIKRPWTKNRCRPSVVVPPVTSLPRGSARITDVFCSSSPETFFSASGWAAWEPFTVFPFEIALRARSPPLARSRATNKQHSRGIARDFKDQFLAFFFSTSLYFCFFFYSFL